MQVVAGINHILHLETSDDSGKKEVEVTVYEKLPANVQANESPLELAANKLVGPVAEVRALAVNIIVWCHRVIHATAHPCNVLVHVLSPGLFLGLPARPVPCMAASPLVCPCRVGTPKAVECVLQCLLVGFAC
jgi:hypothetical protein